MTQPDPRGSYSGDAPVSTPEQDRFNRWDFARHVARILARRRDPSSIVVALYGAWGEGKTSVLNLVRRELQAHTDVVTIQFNPWRFGAEDQLLKAFFRALAQAVDKELSTGIEKMTEAVRQYGGPLAAAFGKKDALEDLSDLIAGQPLDVLRARIETILDESGMRVVVMMDDLDRLEKEEVHAVFRLIKLTADFRHVSYLLACDDEVVAAALQDRYPSGRPGTGRDFLEKIVQVPLQLPTVDPLALRRVCFEGVDRALEEADIELSQPQVQEFVRAFTTIFDDQVRTPRRAKLYGNALSFALPLLKGEAHPVDVMLIEAMRVFFPTLYSFVRTNPELMMGSGLESRYGGERRKEEARERLEQAISELSVDARPAASKLLTTLFPSLNGVLGNMTYGSEWQDKWASEQRVAAKTYFSRYFSYSIGPAEVADTAIDQVLSGPVTEIPTALVALIEPENSGAIISRLRRIEDTVDPAVAVAIARALMPLGGILPDPPALFDFGNPRPQAAILAAALVERQPTQASRIELATELLEGAAPLSFAVEMFRWMRPSANEEPKPHELTHEDAVVLGRLLSERIRAEAGSLSALAKANKRRTGEILYVWDRYGEPGEAKGFIEHSILTDPTAALHLLDTFVPTAWGMATGIPRRSDFERSQYDAVSSLVDPSALMSAIEKTYGSAAAPAERFPHREDQPEDDMLVTARQFRWIHERVQATSSDSLEPEAELGDEGGKAARSGEDNVG